MQEFIIGVLSVVVLGLLWDRSVQAARGGVRRSPWTLPVDVTLRPAALFTERELGLYNCIRLAVQEASLVFVRVPLWAIVHVEAPPPVRLQVLREITLKHLDVVLVHPGTKLVTHVVVFDDEGPVLPDADTRRAVITTIVQAAGLTLCLLNPQTPYTVTELAQRFGMGDEP